VTDQELPTPAKKPWYKKWWIWVLIALGVLVIAAALTPSSEDEETAAGTTTSTSEVSESTTTAPDETTTTTEAATTTTTTQPPTTTTTLPAILAEGSGRGDDVVELDIPDVAVVIELTHAGSANFAVWSLDPAFEYIDLLVNDIGRYDGTRPMQWDQDETVTGLEISANGDWTYEIRPLMQEPQRSCLVEGSGDSAILLTDFADGGGAADLTNDGDSNFAVWAWGDGRDLLVNDIGPYQGTVRVSSGLVAWDITATRNWSIDC
jgi:hypothetical protein